MTHGKAKGQRFQGHRGGHAGRPGVLGEEGRVQAECAGQLTETEAGLPGKAQSAGCQAPGRPQTRRINEQVCLQPFRRPHVHS